MHTWVAVSVSFWVFYNDIFHRVASRNQARAAALMYGRTRPAACSMACNASNNASGDSDVSIATTAFNKNQVRVHKPIAGQSMGGGFLYKEDFLIMLRFGGF